MSGTHAPFEKELLCKQGHRIPVLVGGAFLHGSHDRGGSFVLDLTERRRTEAERQAHQVAEAANRAKSQFLATMSHERFETDGLQPIEAFSVKGHPAFDRALSKVKRSVAPALVEATALLQFAATETAFADGPDSDLDELVITARKRQETLNEVPAAAFSGGDLDQQGISTLQQLGLLSPSLQITSTILIDSIFLRGAGSSPNDPTRPQPGRLADSGRRAAGSIGAGSAARGVG